MGLREKHQNAKLEKKDLKKEIEKIGRKINKQKRKLAKKESQLESINKKLRLFKKKLREREAVAKKEEKKKNKKLVKKGKSIIPEPEKSLRKIKKTEKSLAPTPDKSISKVEKKDHKPAKAITDKDNLKLIEGIGDKTEKVLNERGISTFLQLSNCSSETLDSIIKETFSNYRVFETLTWPEQALLAHKEQWDELKKLQDNLTGGKEE